MENQALTPLTPTGVEAVTFEIIYLKQQTTQNLIEIGKRLIQVKESLSHGEWLPWLEQKVDFSDQQARRLMKVAEECANSTALLNLPQTKVFALLDLPADQREEFIAAPHVVASGEVKTVDEMTTRELTQALKDKKIAEERAVKAEMTAVAAEEARAGMSITWAKMGHEKEQAELKLKEIEAKLKREQLARKEEVDRLSAQVEEAKKAAPSADSAKNIKKLEKELEKAKKEVVDLTEKLNAPVTVEAAVVEKIPDEVERELAELRLKVPELEAKVGQPAPGSAAIVKYGIQFEALVSGFKTLLAALSELKEEDPEAYDKYRKATSGLLEKMAGKL